MKSLENTGQVLKWCEGVWVIEKDRKLAGPRTIQEDDLKMNVPANGGSRVQDRDIQSYFVLGVGEKR